MPPVPLHRIGRRVELASDWASERSHKLIYIGVCLGTDPREPDLLIPGRALSQAPLLREDRLALAGEPRALVLTGGSKRCEPGRIAASAVCIGPIAPKGSSFVTPPLSPCTAPLKVSQAVLGVLPVRLP